MAERKSWVATAEADAVAERETSVLSIPYRRSVLCRKKPRKPLVLQAIMLLGSAGGNLPWTTIPPCYAYYALRVSVLWDSTSHTDTHKYPWPFLTVNSWGGVRNARVWTFVLTTNCHPQTHNTWAETFSTTDPTCNFLVVGSLCTLEAKKPKQ